MYCRTQFNCKYYDKFMRNDAVIRRVMVSAGAVHARLLVVSCVSSKLHAVQCRRDKDCVGVPCYLYVTRGNNNTCGIG